MATLLTFGYSNLRTQDALAALVTENGIDLVLDVRLKRWSSAFPEFSATTAKTFDGIAAYRWVPALGNLNYRGDGPIQIADPSAIVEVTDPLENGLAVALMCVCRSAEGCHRTTVAEMAASVLPGLAIIDL